MKYTHKSKQKRTKKIIKSDEFITESHWTVVSIE
jgi:hypothetical protein